MRRNVQKLKLLNLTEFIQKALIWSNKFEYFAYFNPNHFDYPENPFRHFLAIGCYEKVVSTTENVFDELESRLSEINDYVVGHYSYDLKNELENLTSANQDNIGAPLANFFIPNTLIHISDEGVTIESFDNIADILQAINQQTLSITVSKNAEFNPIISKAVYKEKVDKLRQHIIEGDIYEINFCQEYLANEITIDPIITYNELVKASPSPFSVLYKCQNIYTISGSPERFLKKDGNRIITQPIKGTSKRSPIPEIDESLKQKLRTSEKELAENMMIVDLCRNDLAKSSISGTVKVDEMFGIYSFPLWHQMISTISGKLRPNISPIQIIKNAFPMGSMTGAPKINVMELAEKYETTKRGIYSGSIGYFLPNGDFDFNVVIRSIIYNQQTNKASFMVGGAITYDSDPEEEYNECLTKAKTLFSLFKIKNEK